MECFPSNNQSKTRNKELNQVVELVEVSTPTKQRSINQRETLLLEWKEGALSIALLIEGKYSF